MKITLSKSQWEQMGKEAGWMKKTAMTAVPMGQFGLCVPQRNDASFTGDTSVEKIYQLEFIFKGTNFVLSGPEELPTLINYLVSAFKPEIQQASSTSRNANTQQPQA